ncbi:AAA domain-containing protein, partial [bacterium]|nr:AAA domain-containing protein [bacterium]
MIDLRKNGHALADFLREYVSIRSVTVRDIEKYEEVHWFAHLPQETDCTSGAWTDGDVGEDHWLEVHKQTFNPAPKPPASIEAWCRLDDLEKASETIPPLLSEIPVPDESAEVEAGESVPLRLEPLADHPEVEATYERFRPTWESWATEHRRRRRIHDAYANLFSLHTRLEKQGETLELVVGLGLVHWPRGLANNPELMRRPVVTIAAKTEFDPQQGVVRVRPGDDVVAGQLELDALTPALRPERDRQSEIEALLDQIGIAIWDEDLVGRMLSSLANMIHAESVFGDGLEVIPPGPRGPSVSLAPVLILRRRNQAGMSRVYEQIAARMLADDPSEIPEGWGSLLDQIEDTPNDGAGWESPPEESDPLPEDHDDEIYFPLPANAEQRRIVEGIRKHRGILVQGPPGTGKSHTIANLICHLLAAGKRVLVTAETGRALQVLRDKLPAELQPLCINLLGQTTDGLADLESSVSGIQGRYQNFDATDNARRIVELQTQLDDLRRQLAGIERELLDLRAEETTALDTGMAEYTGTPSEIARRTNQDADRFDWLTASICTATTDRTAPIGGAVLAEWWRLLRDETPESTAIATAHFPSAAALPPASDFAEWTRLESKARDRADAGAVDADPSHLEALGQMSSSDLQMLRTKLEKLRRSIVQLTTETSEWSRNALDQILSHHSNQWERIAEEIRRQLGLVERHLPNAGDHDLDIREGHALRRVGADATQAATALRAGCKWKSFGIFVPAAIKPFAYLSRDVSIDGRPLRTPADCDLASACAAVDLGIEEVRALWAPITPLTSQGNRRIFMSEAWERLETLEGMLRLEEPAQALTGILASLRPTIEIGSWSVEIIDELGRAFDALDARAEARRATESFGELSNAIREHEFSADAHPSLAELRVSLENRDPATYSRCRDEIVAGDELRDRRRRRIEIESHANQVLPGLLELIRPDFDDDEWEPRLRSFDRAWAWRVASNRLEHRTPQGRLGALLQERRDITDRVGRTLAEIASSKAWAHFFARITAPQRQALQGWQAVTKKIGKGTGKSDRVARLRREARQYMRQCRDAVPIWIMPRYLVAEMIEAAPECFDVVIADESSQLGIESLFLLYLAEKHIIVGDDQQISPSAVGIPDDAVISLRQALPETIPHRALLESRSSLYQHAKVRLERAIVLREHFRCMPEIIQFSNDLCYAPSSTPLDPLRNYPPDRLDPLVRR